MKAQKIEITALVLFAAAVAAEFVFKSAALAWLAVVFATIGTIAYFVGQHQAQRARARAGHDHTG